MTPLRRLAVGGACLALVASGTTPPARARRPERPQRGRAPDHRARPGQLQLPRRLRRPPRAAGSTKATTSWPPRAGRCWPSSTPPCGGSSSTTARPARATCWCCGTPRAGSTGTSTSTTTRRGPTTASTRWSTPSPPASRSGAKVTAGQVVAYAGDSGNAESTGSHLHFEIHQPGRRRPSTPTPACGWPRACGSGTAAPSTPTRRPRRRRGRRPATGSSAATAACSPSARPASTARRAGSS